MPESERRRQTRPAQRSSGTGCGVLEEDEPLARRSRARHRAEERMLPRLRGERPARAVEAKEPVPLGRRRRRGGLARDAVVEAVGAVGVRLEEGRDAEGRSGRREELLDLHARDLARRAAAAARTPLERGGVEARAGGRDVEPARPATMPRERGGAAELLRRRRHEEGQPPGEAPRASVSMPRAQPDRRRRGGRSGRTQATQQRGERRRHASPRTRRRGTPRRNAAANGSVGSPRRGADARLERHRPGAATIQAAAKTRARAARPRQRAPRRPARRRPSASAARPARSATQSVVSR